MRALGCYELHDGVTSHLVTKDLVFIKYKVFVVTSITEYCNFGKIKKLTKAVKFYFCICDIIMNVCDRKKELILVGS